LRGGAHLSAADAIPGGTRAAQRTNDAVEHRGLPHNRSASPAVGFRANGPSIRAGGNHRLHGGLLLARVFFLRPRSTLPLRAVGLFR
jgi:hypothetical protein